MTTWEPLGAPPPPRLGPRPPVAPSALGIFGRAMAAGAAAGAMCGAVVGVCLALIIGAAVGMVYGLLVGLALGLVNVPFLVLVAKQRGGRDAARSVAAIVSGFVGALVEFGLEANNGFSGGFWWVRLMVVAALATTAGAAVGGYVVYGRKR